MDNKRKSNFGVVEFKSISRGISVTDEMVKSAEVNIVLATTLCPGKYLTIIRGKVSAVENAIAVADRLGGRHVFSSQVISGVNLKVIKAIGGSMVSAQIGAIGIIESMQMANLISSADICVDTAEVEFIDFRLAKGCGAGSFYIIVGNLSSVTEAVRNATSFLGRNGSLIAYRVIPNPDRQVWRWLRSSLCRC